MQLRRKKCLFVVQSEGCLLSSSVLFLFMVKLCKIWRKTEATRSFLGLCLYHLFYIPSTTEKGFEMVVTGNLDGGHLSQATVVIFLNKTTRCLFLLLFTELMSLFHQEAQWNRGWLFHSILADKKILGSFCYCFLALHIYNSVNFRISFYPSLPPSLLFSNCQY